MKPITSEITPRENAPDMKAGSEHHEIRMGVQEEMRIGRTGAVNVTYSSTL
jgi:hypothetical protein